MLLLCAAAVYWCVVVASGAARAAQVPARAHANQLKLGEDRWLVCSRLDFM